MRGDSAQQKYTPSVRFDASCTRKMHLNISIQIPSSSEHLESDRDTHTPKVSEEGAIINPPGPGAYEPRMGLAALKQARTTIQSDAVARGMLIKLTMNIHYNNNHINDNNDNEYLKRKTLIVSDT